jgi:hypothetical protein
MLRTSSVGKFPWNWHLPWRGLPQCHRAIPSTALDENNIILVAIILSLLRMYVKLFDIFAKERHFLDIFLVEAAHDVHESQVDSRTDEDRNEQCQEQAHIGLEE